MEKGFDSTYTHMLASYKIVLMLPILKEILFAGKVEMSLKTTKMHRFIAPIMMIFTGFIGATAQAQVGSGGDEYWVDGPADVRPGSPGSPDVDVDSAGRSVHVWSVG